MIIWYWTNCWIYWRPYSYSCICKDFWAIFNLVRGMAYSILDRCLVWYEWISSIFVKSSVNCLGTNLNLILYINLLISSLKIRSIVSIWVSLYNIHTLELNLLNVIILIMVYCSICIPWSWQSASYFCLRRLQRWMDVFFSKPIHKFYFKFQFKS